jgi:hypothetical protein
METMRMRWRQERLWCGDVDTTIWGGVEWSRIGGNRGAERGRTERQRDLGDLG